MQLPVVPLEVAVALYISELPESVMGQAQAIQPSDV